MAASVSSQNVVGGERGGQAPLGHPGLLRPWVNVDLLWHTSQIFYKAERQREIPKWNGLMGQLSSEKNKKIQNPKSTITIYNVTAD